MSKVTVYSTQSCPWCAKTKQFLKDNKIPFKDIDIGKDRETAKKIFKKSGSIGVPIIDIGGKIIVGFNEDEMRKALKL